MRKPQMNADGRRYPDEFFRLTDRQVEAVRQRYGWAVDLRKEFVNARGWLREVHTSGKAYKSFVRFFWNWCRREVEFRDRGRAKAEARVRERGRSHEEFWKRAAEAPVKPEAREYYEKVVESETDARLVEYAREALRRHYGVAA
jgi:hypothetical protein